MRARKAAALTRFRQVSEQKRRLAFLLTSRNTRPRTFVTINSLYASHALRAAHADDLEAIASIWHDGWRDGHLGHVPDDVLPHRTLDGFRRRTLPRIGQTTVATVDGEIIGFVTLAEDEVEQLYVCPAGRGTGVAVVLLDHAERVLAQHFDRAWLAVVAGNSRARRFYERRGWAFVREIDNAADDAVIPALRYEKPLSPETLQEAPT